MGSFKRGDNVEVCSDEEGFKGSYYTARIVSTLGGTTYTVQYDTLLNEDESGPLIDVVPIKEVRPAAPLRRVNSEFTVSDKVDAFDNDGWWVGYITGKQGDMCSVYFEYYGVEVVYPVDRLRFHLDWVRGKWVYDRKRAF